ncbi:Uncharacterized protein OS=Chloroherpeton thalassium (strain ATCC 35110 / GB-78) GN=Ctha_1689 PE=4 SV=1 [Gemmataceae bacterium]|nr:Uncharacterized protein OS=Chloroherpeton thalassium (strain ATCC 35110 / GB-78) GN=Ctha_1689 PE=4 SV=1 [Gemmataceae bacterium]VTT97484.1 Uncharacterized protein OS=Chloroherpeton thalassium (strain ATCC 35110 / GB-78) GN=Ctha_1689 PE=4 SV=1 [Gemmataceae bacterium]
MAENLWPADFGQLTEKTPVSILREQAAALGERTANVVFGRVSTDSRGGEFVHHFELYAPVLGYSAGIFSVQHGIDLYPVKLQWSGGGTTTANASDPNEFQTRLKELFSSEKTKKTIASLLAQSKE